MFVFNLQAGRRRMLFSPVSIAMAKPVIPTNFWTIRSVPVFNHPLRVELTVLQHIDPVVMVGFVCQGVVFKAKSITR